MKLLSRRLRRSSLFEGCSTADLEELIKIAKLHCLDRGEKLTLDQRRGGLYVVLSGSVNVLRIHPEQEVFLFVLHSGDFYGEPPLPITHTDQKISFTGSRAFDLLEIEWESLMRQLSRGTTLSAQLLERILASAAAKYADLSREYAHLVRQASLSRQEIESLFITTEKSMDRKKGRDSNRGKR